MIAKGPKISDAEWEVMKTLWDHEPITAVDLYRKLPEGRWKQKTVNTFLARLEAKGVIAATREGRANVYRSQLSESLCRRAEGRHFVSKVFRGQVAPMMLHFLESEDMSDEEIAALKRLLERKGR